MKRAIFIACWAAFFAAVPLEAQGNPPMPEMPGMAGMPGMMLTPLGIPMDRMGSGTTWVPEAAPIASAHTRFRGWDITGHGLVFVQYIAQGSARGDDQLGSLSWGMLMASHGLGGGLLQFRTMLSLDAAGVTARGYPSLLQTGERFRGAPLHDRQHPHDFWMELGALYLRPVAKNLALELYLAPAGEPALGPTAFMHRPSAVDDPFAPIGHHWQDATHISFGVVTAGIFAHQWKVEGSVFNGREPDDSRWGFDFARLDSWSGRVTLHPTASWSATAGYGRIRETGETLDRMAASVLHGTRLGRDGQWATALVYGANRIAGQDKWTRSVLLESEVVAGRSNTVFGRVEWAEKSEFDLSVGSSESRTFGIGMASVGYIRDLGSARGLTLGLGIRGSMSVIPGALDPFYGSRHPVGGAVFLRLRPGPSSSYPASATGDRTAPLR